MNLTKNMRNNLDALLSIALNTNYRNIRLMKYDMLDDTFMCNFVRKVSLNHLKKINEYFKVDIRDKEIMYSLIVNKNTDTIKLSIENIENKKISLFDDVEETCNKINDYNKKITSRLYNVSKYLYETLYPTDNETFDWTFYYIANNKTHLGFANADLQNPHSIKVFAQDFIKYENQSFPDFYKNVDKYFGTKNDALVICMRRNHNSKYCSNWRPCLYGSSIEVLLN